MDASSVDTSSVGHAWLAAKDWTTRHKLAVGGVGILVLVAIVVIILVHPWHKSCPIDEVYQDGKCVPRRTDACGNFKFQRLDTMGWTGTGSANEWFDSNISVIKSKSKNAAPQLVQNGEVYGVCSCKESDGVVRGKGAKCAVALVNDKDCTSIFNTNYQLRSQNGSNQCGCVDNQYGKTCENVGYKCNGAGEAGKGGDVSQKGLLTNSPLYDKCYCDVSAGTATWDKDKGCMCDGVIDEISQPKSTREYGCVLRQETQPTKPVKPQGQSKYTCPIGLRCPHDCGPDVKYTSDKKSEIYCDKPEGLANVGVKFMNGKLECICTKGNSCQQMVCPGCPASMTPSKWDKQDQHAWCARYANSIDKTCCQPTSGRKSCYPHNTSLGFTCNLTKS